VKKYKLFFVFVIVLLVCVIGLWIYLEKVLVPERNFNINSVVSEEENVKAVVSKVQLGEADAGMVYRSDVTAAVRRYVTAIELPEDANVLASYPIAAVTPSAAPELAHAFVDLVRSPAGQKVLAAHGLLPAPATAP